MNTDILTLSDFQYDVRQFLTKCFGPEVVSDKEERNYRFFEEATELVQAGGMSKENCYKLVDYVYGRPVGEIEQEIGGTLVTLFGLMSAHDVEANEAAQKEIASCWEKIDKMRAKWENKKIRSFKHDPLP